jgi:pyruvate dehydrogenase E1 component beta subunit
MSSAPALSRSVRFADAILQAQRKALSKDESVMLLGECVGKMGGLRGESQGLLAEFGPKRVVDTPISEAATLGLAAGLAMAGKKVIVSLSGPDRLASAWEVLRLELANLQSRTQGAFSSTVVIRVPAGRGMGGGRYLQAAPEGNLCNVEGLRVLAPSSGEMAADMLTAALEAQGPTIILESNALWQRREKPTGESHGLNGATICKSGEDITLIAYGGSVELAQALAAKGEKEGFSAEVVELRSLQPLDVETIGTSVRKTGHVLFLHESEGLVNRLSSCITDTAFMYLEAPLQSSQSTDLEALSACIWATFET